MLKEDIIKKANEIIDVTKHNQEKYHNERRLIFNLLKKCDDEENIDMLESAIKIFENNQKIENENVKYRRLELDNLEKSIKNQKIRQEDGTIGEIILFVIEDDDKNKYSFFVRENAHNYIENHKEKFTKNTSIGIIKNDNIDIENLILKIVNEKE